MKANNRAFLFYINIIKMTFASKIRFFLTFIGISVSVFGFTMALILSNSYYESKMDVYSSADPTVVAVCGTYDGTSFRLLNGEYEHKSEEIIVTSRVTIDTIQINNGTSVSVVGIIHGVENTDVILQTDSDQFIPIKSDFLYGNGITLADNQKNKQIAVIDEYTALLLFGSVENCIGKEISIGESRNIVFTDQSDSVRSHVFSISGVLNNTKLTEHTKIENQKRINNGINNLIVYVDIYCPLSTLGELFPDWKYSINSIYYFNTADDAVAYQNNNLNSNSLLEISSSEVQMITSESLLQALRKDLKDAKKIINIGILVLSLIFGISISSVVFFAIKERIPEIGIRKAFGATKTDIVFQIFCEMLLISIIASLIATFLAVYFSKMFEYYLVNSLFVYFKIYFSASDIVIPILVGIAQSTIFGVIPGIYGSKIPVTKALKFE